MTTLPPINRFNLERLLIEAQVFVHSRDAIAICDTHLHVMAVNKAFSAITGFESSDVIGNNLKEWMAFDEASWLITEAALKEDSFCQHEHDCPHKDVPSFPAMLSIYR